MKRILGRRFKLLIVGAVLATVLSAGTYLAQSKYEAVHAVAANKQHTEQVVTKPDKPATLEDFQAVIADARASVVKIEGDACDYTLDGTGFIIGPDLVLTNAHAVSGMAKPYVIDATGKHKGTTIFLDPNFDVAIIRVNGLSGKPLKLDTPSTGIAIQGSQSGKHSVILGYPDGGDFQSQLVDIGEEYTIVTTDIYGEGSTPPRNVVALHTKIVPGSSGSPVVQENGTVAAIVFAIDPDVPNKALALPVHVFYGEIQKAEQLSEQVVTSRCATFDIR